MTTYTLIDSNGDARYTSLTIERAARRANINANFRN